MKKLTIVLFVFCVVVMAGTSYAAPNFDALYDIISKEISEERAYDYTGRIWQYDKWSNLSMWNKSAREVQSIMRDRGFDEALVIPTPADGVTKYGDWTNPIGWDCTRATIEIIEPVGLPDDIRYLSSMTSNPSSLTFFAAPTPEGGLVSELVILPGSDEDALKQIDARGKIILTSANAGGLKKHLKQYGVHGIVYDRPVGPHKDANVWHNTWSDHPGGWMMKGDDSRHGFNFSISENKGAALRKLIADGQTVKARVVIDSRFYTDGSLPYVVGSVKGADPKAGEVLIGGHLFEWGANDNATGCAIMLETVGTLNDLIKRGLLPRPKRTVRVWMGQEMYGSLPFTERYIENLRKTVAVVACDTPTPAYDQLSSTVKIFENPALSPTYTDAVYTDFFRSYYRKIRSNKIVLNEPFEGGTDTYFVEPLIGAPTNFLYMENGTWLHHNSRDTLEMVDKRSLRDLCLVNAIYLYYMADAGIENIHEIADLTFAWGTDDILDTSAEMRARIATAGNGVALGRLLTDGSKQIAFRTALREQGVMSILRLMDDDNKDAAKKILDGYQRDTAELGKLAGKQFNSAVKASAKRRSLKIEKYARTPESWDNEAAKLYPKALKFGTLTLESIDPEEWTPITHSPRWWSTRNWPAAAYWWCDGTRNLIEVRNKVELEAGKEMKGFDLVAYFNLLEKHGLVEYVKQ